MNLKKAKALRRLVRKLKRDPRDAQYDHAVKRLVKHPPLTAGGRPLYMPMITSTLKTDCGRAIYRELKKAA